MNTRATDLLRRPVPYFQSPIMRISLDVSWFRLLGGMGMILACIDLEFFGHGITQRVLGKHALNCFFQRTTREASLHGLEIGLADATDVASMTVILFVSVFVAGHA